MLTSDKKDGNLDTSSIEFSKDEKWQAAKESFQEQTIHTSNEVDSTPLIGTIFCSSKEEVKRATINPTRVEKAIETIKRNKDIERRGF
jgi:hypothetical protein